MMNSSKLASIVLLLIFNWTFFCAGIFLNSVVIISIRRSSQLRKKLCYFMICLLSCADFAVVVIIHPSIAWIAYYYGEKYKTNEIIFRSVFFVVLGISVLMVLTLNIERFLAVKFPFFHQTQVTKKSLIAFAACLVCFFVLLQSLVWLNIIQSTLYITLPLFSVILVYLNFEMYKIARSKERNMARMNSMDNSTRNYQKTSVPTFLIVILLMFFMLPRAVTSAYISYSSNITFHKILKVHLELWSNTIMAMSSSFNCLVFFWKISILRREGLKIVGKLNFCKTLEE
ncbi:uncharacterized protein LOC124439985 [Xenia sp. Carnegie-2017]|uniref:uncharacterized protein LOC124439985 n=1 Tax=Xenia sp. Carnegie-2017 TaxID=2897299 RepID=UPI001F0477E4|nr:uncharacterized protein LOC124439985 [Xenia sp. Carnegie-2017]